MRSVLGYLEEGVDSGVNGNGSDATFSKNNFPEPALDIPRLADAFCSEIKAHHMAGPFSPNHIENAKINSLLSVKKPDGSRRQVGNLSAPKGSSFNDGIDPESLKEWRVHQTTSKQISDMIARSGHGSWLSCCDMVSAYKTLPVCKKQRRLQCFRFLGKDFVDLRMIFGDKKACMFFDKFHCCIIEYLVLPKCPIPRQWVGRTIDDVPIVAPQNARDNIDKFVKGYKGQLSQLGIKYAPEDIERRKAFSPHTSGEMLGIWFDSVSMTWKLPDRKIVELINNIINAIKEGSRVSLNDIEIIFGKLNHIAQVCSPVKLLLGEILQFLQKVISGAPDEAQFRYDKRFLIPDPMKHDLRTFLAIIWNTICHPLPIIEDNSPLSVGALHVYTDYSGQLITSPSLGVYVPAVASEAPLVCSLAYPRAFLLKQDEAGHKVFSKSTTLEALGFLVPLILDPTRFLGKLVLVLTDNAAAV